MHKIKTITLNKKQIDKIATNAKVNSEILLKDIADFIDYDWVWFKAEGQEENSKIITDAIQQAILNDHKIITGPITASQIHLESPLIRGLEYISCMIINRELKELCLFRKIWNNLDAVRFVGHESISKLNERRFELAYPLNLNKNPLNPLLALISLPDTVTQLDAIYEEFDSETRKEIIRSQKNVYLETIQLAAEVRKFSPPQILGLKEQFSTENTKFSIACIILPGKENLLAETILSLRNQTHSNWELLIIAFTPPQITLQANCIWYELNDDDDSTDILNKYIFSQSGLCSLMEAGDQLAPFALTLIAAEYSKTKNTAFYSNSFIIDSFPSFRKPIKSVVCSMTWDAIIQS